MAPISNSVTLSTPFPPFVSECRSRASRSVIVPTLNTILCYVKLLSQGTINQLHEVLNHNPQRKKQNRNMPTPNTSPPQHSTSHTQHATLNTQHATRNTQHATRNTQHATQNTHTQHATCNTQHNTTQNTHTTCNTHLHLPNRFLCACLCLTQTYHPRIRHHRAGWCARITFQKR
jgi:hypothetical protein